MEGGIPFGKIYDDTTPPTPPRCHQRGRSVRRFPTWGPSEWEDCVGQSQSDTPPTATVNLCHLSNQPPPLTSPPKSNTALV